MFLVIGERASVAIPIETATEIASIQSIGCIFLKHHVLPVDISAYGHAMRAPLRMIVIGTAHLGARHIKFQRDGIIRDGSPHAVVALYGIRALGSRHWSSSRLGRLSRLSRLGRLSRLSRLGYLSRLFFLIAGGAHEHPYPQSDDRCREEPHYGVERAIGAALLRSLRVDYPDILLGRLWSLLPIILTDFRSAFGTELCPIGNLCLTNRTFHRDHIYDDANLYKKM